MRSVPYRSVPVVALLLCCRAHAVGPAVDAGNNSMADSDVICLTDTPVIKEGGSAQLKAWTVAPNRDSASSSARFDWVVDAGRIEPVVQAPRWDLSSVTVPNGVSIAKAIVTVTRAGRG